MGTYGGETQWLVQDSHNPVAQPISTYTNGGAETPEELYYMLTGNIPTGNEQEEEENEYAHEDKMAQDAMTSEQPVVGENISSNSKGIAGALTNPTELSKEKGNIQQSYPIKYNGKNYKDVEHAYQTNKGPYLVNKTTDQLMANLITIKLRTYPRLVQAIKAKGGLAWLEASTHTVKGDDYWETGESKQNAFMKALITAYQHVTKEKAPIEQPVQQQKKQIGSITI